MGKAIINACIGSAALQAAEAVVKATYEVGDVSESSVGAIEEIIRRELIVVFADAFGIRKPTED